LHRSTHTLTVTHTVISISEQRRETLNKSLEELQKEYEESTARLEQEQRKLQRLKNRKSYLESGSRKQRNHRLITRGASVESVMPEVKILTEQEFYSLMERISQWQPVRNMVRIVVENHNRTSEKKDGD
jgi:predicted  nucleic acid-binding Zn-ribbon protein